MPMDQGCEAGEVEMVDAFDGEVGEMGPGDAVAEGFEQAVFGVEVRGAETQALELRHRGEEVGDCAGGDDGLGVVEVGLFEVVVEVLGVGHERVD